MSKLKVFIGSSVNGLVYAQCLAEILNVGKQFQAEDWVSFFDRKGAAINIDTLFDALDEFDIALFFVSADYGIGDIQFNRAGKKIVGNHKGYYGAKPNVWFEHGLFTGRLGIEKSQIVMEERDAKTKPLMVLSDYYGVNPYMYKLADDIKDEVHRFVIRNKRTLSSFAQLDKGLKSKLRTSMRGLVGVLKADIPRFKRAPLYYTVQTLKSREDCYAMGQKIIKDAKRRVFTSLSYEGELRQQGHDAKYPGGLWPTIRRKIDQLKRRNIIQPGESRRMFKRYLNLGNKYIYKQGEEILKSYSNYVEVRDTYCHFIEVVITDDRVLLVLPDTEHMSAKVETGVLVHSQAAADEFAEWFVKILPEPNKLRIDSVKRLAAYRNFEWNAPFRRSDLKRCIACTSGMKLPSQISKKLVSMGLLSS